MKRNLLLYQQIVKNSLLEKLNAGVKHFLIEGKSGTGKTYLMNEIIDEITYKDNYEVFYMDGDKQCTTREFYPIERCLSDKKKDQLKSSLKNTLPLTARAIPFVGYASESVIKEIMNFSETKFKDANSYFTDKEISIIYKMKHAAQNKPFLIYIDNLQWWDEKSVDFIYQILKEKNEENSLFYNTAFIINWTTDQFDDITHSKKIILNNNFIFNKFQLDLVNKTEYSYLLKHFGLKKEFDIKIIETLYSITGGHLHLTKAVINYIVENEEKIDDIEHLISQKEVGIFIEERLKNYGAEGLLIEELLKYASIIGISFTFFELESITKKNEYDIKKLLSNANKLHLVTEVESNKNVNFIHEVIRELFNKKLDEESSLYYQAYSECLKIIKPNSYLSRGIALLKAGKLNDAAILYILDFLKKTREKDAINNEYEKELNVLANDIRAQEYISVMKECYQHYHEGDLNSSIKKLSWIEDIYPIELLAERDYLKALCLNKKLDSDSRTKAVNMLNRYKTLENINEESEIWCRILLLQIISYIHINDKDNAIKNEKKINVYLSNRMNYDLDAEDKINILRRKASAIHEITFAYRQTKKSVDYFGPIEAPLNPIQYYYSLNNHAANALVIGDFDISFDYANLAIKLIKDFKQIDFPNPEKLINNYILSGIASKKMSIENGIEHFKEIFKKTDQSADSILMRINQAVLYAINNDLQEAGKLLNILQQKLLDQNSIELYYSYYVDSNMMVVEYLKGNKELAINLWNKLSYVPSIGESKYYKERHELIKSLFEMDLKVTGKEWSNLLNKYFPEFDEKYDEKSFTNGFLTSDIQFWSES